MVYSLPAAVVLAVYPVAHSVVSWGVMLWTVWYGARALRRLRRGARLAVPAPSAG